jgi:hypothetical protein
VIKAADAFKVLPSGLKDALLEEYRGIIQNFLEHRWSPSELSGGRLCEIVYSILDGFAKNAFAAAPFKPKDFVSSCRMLEVHTHVPRSFQILIPRLLPALYEIRNNRGVGHVGGDVDPNHMDAIAVLSMANWIMAELVRVLHSVSIRDAQAIVDTLAERRMPLVWIGDVGKRVLDPKMPLKEQLLLLMASAPGSVSTKDLQSWTGYKKQSYFYRLLRQLHAQRLLELSVDETVAQLLPPGSLFVEALISVRTDAKA